MDADDLSLERAAYAAGVDDLSVGDDDAHASPLWRAATLLPRVEGRAPADVEAEIDRWAEQVRERLPHAGSIVAMHDVLFATAGFRGDTAEYDHPHNSFVDDVVRRRRGLPIALSLVFFEVARRAGVQAWGLALPGHYMAAIGVDADHFAVVDAFSGGRLLSLDEVAKRVQVPVSEVGELLQPAGAGATLRRMLTNLRGSYLRRQQHEPLERVLSRLLLLQSNDPDLWLERADVRRFLLDDEGALADVDAAVRVAAGDPDVAAAADALRSAIAKRMIH